MGSDPNKNEREFVRNATDKLEGDHFSLFDAFRCAGAGIGYTFKSQRNIRIQIVVAVLAVVLGIVLQIPPASWVAILICIGLVFAAECLNTAVESVVDLVSPGYSELAKRAKDCAAGCVLVCVITAVIVGILIYGFALASILFS